MATQAHIGNLQAGVHAQLASQLLQSLKSRECNEAPNESVAENQEAELKNEPLSPKVFSLSVEFVALPGRTERLCREIPLAMRQANANSENFAGCIVLISEEEARLVTVITMWTGKDHSKTCNDSLDQLKRLLEPHVDTWMRTRRFISLVSIP